MLWGAGHSVASIPLESSWYIHISTSIKTIAAQFILGIICYDVFIMPTSGAFYMNRFYIRLHLHPSNSPSILAFLLLQARTTHAPYVDMSSIGADEYRLLVCNPRALSHFFLCLNILDLALFNLFI